ncbi:Fis family transcriptional regulator (plasmid) [Caballeronia sp. S22]
MLLPLPESAVREASLARHLTWVACKQEAGSAYLVNELVRLVYLTYYVQDAGYGDTELTVYARAEAALERCLEKAERDSVWRFEPDDAALFEAILRQGDRQLDGAPSYVYMDACARLDRFTVSCGRRSPLPSAARMQ